jgi:hypothetical protein
VPSGENQWTELLRADKRRSKGDLTQLRRRVWYAISVVETGMKGAMSDDDHDGIRKWAHALNQLASTYLKIAFDSDLEVRLEAIEQRFQAEDKSHAHAGPNSSARSR